MPYETSFTLLPTNHGPRPLTGHAALGSEMETAITLQALDGVEVETMADVAPKVQIYAKARVVKL